MAVAVIIILGVVTVLLGLVLVIGSIVAIFEDK